METELAINIRINQRINHLACGPYLAEGKPIDMSAIVVMDYPLT
jgi:hypothetical protein